MRLVHWISAGWPTPPSDKDNPSARASSTRLKTNDDFHERRATFILVSAGFVDDLRSTDL